jgi:hypothetical protein
VGATLDILESRARELLAERPGLFRLPPSASLTRLPGASVRLDDGRIWVVTLGVEKDAVPVDGAFVTFRVHSGNLVQLGCARVADALEQAPTAPRRDAAEARALALTTLSAMLEAGPRQAASVSEALEPGTVVLLPWPTREATPGKGLTYRLAWRTSFRLDGLIETWVAHVDATSGDVVALHDANLYSCADPAAPRGHVTGGVTNGPIEETTPLERALPHVLVTQGSAEPADASGSFAVEPGARAEAGLTGTFFRVACGGCTDPPQARVAAAVAGDLAFGLGGVEATGNGRSTPAERNAYYHLNLVQALARGHLDDAAAGGYFTSGQVAIVNLEDTCNGFASTRATFYLRGDASCNNPGEIPDVFYHEWGHSLDIATLSGAALDLARSEGMADTTAFLATHDARIVPYLDRGDSEGVRNADEDVTRSGLMTVSRVPAACPPGNGPQGYEQHCEGQVFLQAHWHLGRLLRAQVGEEAGWHALERLFFLSLPLSDTYLPDQTDSAYDAVVLVDDDNGNLADGTPHGTEILTAFAHHEMASTPPVGDSAGCAPPPAPVLAARLETDAPTGEHAAVLTWTSDPAHVRYDVLGNEGLGTEADVRVAIVNAPASGVTIPNLLPGVTYRWRVAATDAAGCRSAPSGRAVVTPGAALQLEVAGVSVLDPLGDGDGALDRGERALLSVSLANVGTTDAIGVVATLSTSHQDVVVRRAGASFPDLTAGAVQAVDPPGFEVEVGRYVVACGERVPFAVDVETTTGCVRASFELELLPDDVVDVLVDPFEADTGWRVNADGTDDATDGAWVREDPRPAWNSLQPGADHSTPGTTCFVTGNRAGADITQIHDDDVDGGCTSVQGPVYSLTGRTSLRLSYWRRFHVFTGLGGDVFRADVSNDGGGTWLPLEVVEATAPSWEEATFDLDALLGEPADRVVVRFTACDLGQDSFVEALVDDVIIREVAWSCGCGLTQPPAAPGGVLRATGRKDEDGVEMEWMRATLPADHDFRLYRGQRADALTRLVTPAGHLGSSWDDRMAPGPLYFYSLRLADCLGGESPDAPP